MEWDGMEWDGMGWDDFIIYKIETLHRIIVGCKLVRTKQIYIQIQMQTRVSENRERERERERDEDRIWGKKILIFMGVMVGLIAANASYFDGGTDANALIKMVMHIYDFMLSYINFSQKVLCDMISFIVGLVFMILFSLSSIIIIMLLGIPFLALIFTFTNI